MLCQRFNILTKLFGSTGVRRIITRSFLRRQLFKCSFADTPYSHHLRYRLFAPCNRYCNSVGRPPLTSFFYHVIYCGLLQTYFRLSLRNATITLLLSNPTSIYHHNAVLCGLLRQLYQFDVILDCLRDPLSYPLLILFWFGLPLHLAALTLLPLDPASKPSHNVISCWGLHCSHRSDTVFSQPATDVRLPLVFLSTFLSVATSCTQSSSNIIRCLWNRILFWMLEANNM